MDVTTAEPRDPADVPTDELGDELARQAAHVNAGLCRLLELVGERKRRGGWWGDVTFAHYLAWRAGLSPAQAREYERVGERLLELPLIRDAFSRGELPYAKARALALVADSDSEEKLLPLARDLTASQLERSVAAYRRYSREEANEQQELEFLRYSWADDGSLHLRARLPAAEGTLVLRALEASREALRTRRREQEKAKAAADTNGGSEESESAEGEDESESPAPEQPARRWEQLPEPGCRVTNADAFVAMCDLALAKPQGERSGAERTQVVVHVDARTLASDEDGRSHLEDGPALSPETARRLACDGSIVTQIEKEGKALSSGRKTRAISPALGRALKERDGSCRFPGCEKTRFLEGHHIRHWAHGGETSQENTLLLCRSHHVFVHEGGYSVARSDDGEVSWKSPSGFAIPMVPRPPPSYPRALQEQNECRGLNIDEQTCWKGLYERMDLSATVEAVWGIVEPGD